MSREETKVKSFKAIISVLSAVIIVLSCMFVPAYACKAMGRKAASVSEGIEALRDQFEKFQGPEKNGYALDARFYSPVGNNDSTKYPIVIFLHGIGHGDYEGSQLDDSFMPFWSSAEFQSRFSDAGGAFILLPRAPEDSKAYWNESFVEPLRALLDAFIEEHKDNVDTTRIAITGSSAGGGMCWHMLEAFPDFFSCAFPLASTVTPSTDTIKAAKSTAIWILASEKDPVVNYKTSTLKIWKKIVEYNDNPQNCRLSTFQKVYKPDGEPASDNHHLATVITYDLHTTDEGLYPELETIDGLGNVLDLTSPNGIITWISSIHSGNSGEASEGGTGNLKYNFLTKIANFLQNKLYYVVHLVQTALGLKDDPLKV